MKTGILRTLASMVVLALMLLSYLIGYRNGSAFHAPVVYVATDLLGTPAHETKNGSRVYDRHPVHVNTISPETR